MCLCTSSSFPLALWATPTSQNYPKAPSAAKEINKWHPSMTRPCSIGWRKAKLPLRPNSRLSSRTQVTRLLGQEGDRFLAEVRDIWERWKEVGTHLAFCSYLLLLLQPPLQGAAPSPAAAAPFLADGASAAPPSPAGVTTPSQPGCAHRPPVMPGKGQ